jgi:tetratricopeptide (TPR) repeat protein
VETLTFLFTDIEGSTALVRRLGEGLYTQLLADHHWLIRSGLAAYDGREVDTQGDAFFAVFSSPRACVAAVMEIQRALAAHGWPGGEQVRVRMGIHTGEAAKTATGLVGLDVHRAARVAAVAHGARCCCRRRRRRWSATRSRLLASDLIEPARCERLFAEAIACTERSGDTLTGSFLHGNAGVLALRAGDIPAARAYLQQAAQAMRALGYESPAMPITMGWVLRQDNDPDSARASFETALRISRRSGYLFDIAYASLGLACVAADLGDPRRAAELHGVAQAFLDRMGEPWPEPEARYRRDSLDQVRAHLGQEQLERAYAKGMALSSGEALGLASGKAHHQG